MKTQIAAVLVAGASMLTGMPAHAHGGVNWSVTVGSPGYYSYYPPPTGVVVWPQSQYIYGAPPAAFAPPPVYVQPAPVYGYGAYPPPVLYVNPCCYNNGNWGHGGHGGHGHRGRW